LYLRFKTNATTEFGDGKSLEQSQNSVKQANNKQKKEGKQKNKRD
jgi:hypothetical protein